MDPKRFTSRLALILCVLVNRRLDEWVEESRLDFSKIETKSTEVAAKQEAESSSTQVFICLLFAPRWF
jgi:RNA binding activity-knot of a chromodomain